MIQLFGYALISQLAYRLSIVFSTVLLSNYLNVSDFATYAYFSLTVGTFASILNLGLASKATIIFAKENLNSQKTESNYFQSKVVLITIPFILAALLFFGWLYPKDIVVGNNAISSVKIGFGIGVYSSIAILLAANHGLQNHKMVALSSVLFAVILNILIYCGAIIDSLLFAINSYLLAGVIFLLSLLAALNRRCSTVTKHVFLLSNVKLIPQLLKNSSSIFLSSCIINSGIWICGKLILLYFSDPIAKFADFSIAVQWYSLVLFLPIVLNRIYVPRFAIATIENNTHGKSLFKLLVESCVFSILMSVIVLLGIFLTNDITSSLYGESVLNNKKLITLFATSAVAGSTVIMLNSCVLAIGKDFLLVFTATVWLSILIGLTLIASSVEEVAHALLIANIFVTIFLLVIVKRLISTKNSS